MVRDHLEFAGIEADTRLGHFFPHRLTELIEYCRHNPEFHIVSMLKNSVSKVNCAVENAGFYLLAEGDSDPGLIYCEVQNNEQLENLKITEFLFGS